MNPKDYIIGLCRALQDLDKTQIGALIERVRLARDEGATVWLIGNGGSMATAIHFAADLSKTPDHPVQTVALDNPALMTAIGNDWDYKRVFSHPLRWAREKDVLIAISGSGNSQNVLDAAQNFRGTVVALVGFDGGDLLGMADMVVHVHNSNYGIVEDAHCAILHMVVEALK